LESLSFESELPFDPVLSELVRDDDEVDACLPSWSWSLPLPSLDPDDAPRLLPVPTSSGVLSALISDGLPLLLGSIKSDMFVLLGDPFDVPSSVPPLPLPPRLSILRLLLPDLLLPLPLPPAFTADERNGGEEEADEAWDLDEAIDSSWSRVVWPSPLEFVDSFDTVFDCSLEFEESVFESPLSEFVSFSGD